jgi:hypothetical protein
MPYDRPAEEAISNAYAAIALKAERLPVTIREPAQALEHADGVLLLGANRVSALMQANIDGPWGDQLLALRELAIEYAAQVLVGVKVAIASGAILSVVSPTQDRLASMVADYAHGQHGSIHVEELGEHDDQTLVEQFGTPLMIRGVRPPGGSNSERELVRDAFGAIGAAATLIAAIDERPKLRRDW